MSKKGEIIDVVSTDDSVMGQTDVHTAHAESILHRVVGVLLFTQDSRMVVQTGNKFGKYDMAAGGHVGVGEDPRDAAPRELKEELGVVTKLKRVVAFIPKETRHSHFWYVFEGVAPMDWVFVQTEEVSAVTTVTIEEIIKGMNQNPEAWTFGFQNVMCEYLKTKGIDLVTSLS